MTEQRTQFLAPHDEPVIGYRFVHRAPDGSRHVFYGRYVEIERPTRLVSTFIYEAAPEGWLERQRHPR